MFQFEPQLTLDELRVWNRELAGEYDLMGPGFDPVVESPAQSTRIRAGFAPAHEAQMGAFLREVIGVCDD